MSDDSAKAERQRNAAALEAGLTFRKFLLSTVSHLALMAGYPWHLAAERAERLRRARLDLSPAGRAS